MEIKVRMNDHGWLEISRLKFWGLDLAMDVRSWCRDSNH